MIKSIYYIDFGLWCIQWHHNLKNPGGIIHFCGYGAPVIGGVNIGCDIKGRRRGGVGIDKTSTFGKSNMGFEGDAG